MSVTQTFAFFPNLFLDFFCVFSLFLCFGCSCLPYFFPTALSFVSLSLSLSFKRQVRPLTQTFFAFISPFDSLSLFLCFVCIPTFPIFFLLFLGPSFSHDLPFTTADILR